MCVPTSPGGRAPWSCAVQISPWNARTKRLTSARRSKARKSIAAGADSGRSATQPCRAPVGAPRPWSDDVSFAQPRLSAVLDAICSSAAGGGAGWAFTSRGSWLFANIRDSGPAPPQACGAGHEERSEAEGSALPSARGDRRDRRTARSLRPSGSTDDRSRGADARRAVLGGARRRGASRCRSRLDEASLAPDRRPPEPCDRQNRATAKPCDRPDRQTQRQRFPQREANG